MSARAALSHEHLLRTIFVRVDDGGARPRVARVSRLWRAMARWVHPTSAYVRALDDWWYEGEVVDVHFARELFALARRHIDPLQEREVLLAAATQGLDAHVAHWLRVIAAHGCLRNVDMDDVVCRAVARGHVCVLDLLVAQGYISDASLAPPTARYLNYACSFGHLAVVERVLRCAADPAAHVATNNNAALRVAAREGHVACVCALLAHGGDPSALRCNALVWATRFGHDAVVRVLLRDTRVDVTPAMAANLLYAAGRYSHTKTVRALLADARFDDDAQLAAADLARARQPGVDLDYTSIVCATLCAARDATASPPDDGDDEM